MNRDTAEKARMERRAQTIDAFGLACFAMVAFCSLASLHRGDYELTAVGGFATYTVGWLLFGGGR